MSNYEEIMDRIIAENPIPATQSNTHSDGDGPWDKGILRERLEAWKENIPEFDFKETDRRDGFAIVCPGNFGDGWPDGEMHGDIAHSPNDSTIVYEEHGWPKFSCRHNHCGEGAEHGKKTWKDLQEFYDPNRKYHRLEKEYEYEDEGIVPDVDMIDEVETLAAVADSEGDEAIKTVDFLNADDLAATETVEALVESAAPAKATESTSDPESTTTNESTNPAEPSLLEMPESCMRGKLGEWARSMDIPLGFAYPTVIAYYSSRPQFDRMLGTRINVYVALIGRTGSGKNVAIDRGEEVTGVRKGEDFKRLDVGGDMQLTRALGNHSFTSGRGANKVTTKIPGPRKLLMINDEITNVLGKTAIEGSTLASKLCSMWDCNEYSKPDGKDVIEVNCRLSWIGGLPATEEDTTRFTELFSSQTNHGLYQRFIFGYTKQEFIWRYWVRPDDRQPLDIEEAEEKMFAQAAHGGITEVISVTPEAQEAIDNWRPDIDWSRWDFGRLKQNLVKVAYLTASASGLDELILDYVQGAIEFMDWQVELRKKFVTSQSELNNRQANFADTKLIPELEKRGARTKFVSWRRVAHDLKWHRQVDADLMLRTVESLIKMGVLIPEPPQLDDDGKEVKLKPNEQARGRVRLANYKRLGQ